MVVRTSLELYDKLITKDTVHRVLGSSSGAIRDAIANVMERNRKPFLVVAPSKEIWQRGRKYVFTVNLIKRKRRPPLLS